MIHAIRNHAKKILFRIAVGVGKYAIENTHWQRGDITRRHHYFYASIQGGNLSSLESPAAGAHDIDALAINFSTGQEVIHGANAVPNFPSGQICSREIGEIAQYRVFGANQVVTAFSTFRIPELAAFALPNGIPRQSHVTSLGESLTQFLIIVFPVRGVPRR